MTKKPGTNAPQPNSTGAPAAGLATRAEQSVSAPAPTQKAAKKRVLFVCIGNSCRSQLAEAFARAYGADVMEAHSAGLAPAVEVAALTKHFLSGRNLNADDLFPKSIDVAAKARYDLLVNMSGKAISLPGARVLHWPVEDPIGKNEEEFRAVAEQVERLVQRLVLDLRHGG